MGEAYPNLAAQEARITEVLRVEEERFFETLATGMQILDEALAGGVKVLPGDVAFKLHDTYGFPLDLSADVCRENGVEVDSAGFDAAMEQQKAQGPRRRQVQDGQGAGVHRRRQHLRRLRTPGRQAAKIVALYADGISVAELKAGQNGVVVLDTTPFYAESGGQVGDAGRASSATRRAVRGRRHAEDQGRRVWPPRHAARPARSRWATRSRPMSTPRVRAATVRNHSVTHLMHKALREVLGGHVQQKGSLVNAERTRFDFAHNAPVTDAQIREIEARVNAEILANAADPGARDGHRVGAEDRRHDAVRREVRRNGARARHRQQPRTVRRHPRAAHR